jgi:hypothetical protein
VVFKAYTKYLIHPTIHHCVVFQAMDEDESKSVTLEEFQNYLNSRARQRQHQQPQQQEWQRRMALHGSEEHGEEDRWPSPSSANPEEAFSNSGQHGRSPASTTTLHSHEMSAPHPWAGSGSLDARELMSARDVDARKDVVALHSVVKDFNTEVALLRQDNQMLKHQQNELVSRGSNN